MVVSVELRPPRLQDAAALVGLFGEFGRMYDADHESQSDIESWFTNPGMDLNRDARIALIGDEIAGYGDVGDAGKDGRMLYLDVRLDPERLDTATPPLFDFVEARAAELAGPGSVVKVWSPERAEGLRRLIEDRGYVFDSYSLRMGIKLDGELPAPEWPDDISLRPFDRENDTELVYAVNQEAFEDEPDHVRDPYDEWVHWALREPFDPALWFLAFDGGELAGISLCRPGRGEDPDFGWVQVLGVRRPWRRRGLGSALLRHSFRELQTKGKRRAGLGVHADNLAAVNLYERAGMRRERTNLWFRKEV